MEVRAAGNEPSGSASAAARPLRGFTRRVYHGSERLATRPGPGGTPTMSLPLDDRTRFGLMTRLPTPELTRRTVALLDRLEFDSVWVGDHLAFTTPILDPFVQLSYAAALSPRLTVGSAVYLAADAPSRAGGQAGGVARPSGGRPLHLRHRARRRIPARMGACGCTAQRTRRAHDRVHRGAEEALDRRAGLA